MARNVLDVLKRMIAKEKSARAIGEIAEADTFAAKIAEMLTNHKLQMSDIEAEERRTSTPMGGVAFDLRMVFGLKDPDVPAYWRIAIGNAIAEINTCKFLGDPRHDYMFAFVGREDSTIACCMMYEYFLELAARLANRTIKSRKQRLKRADEFNRAVGLPQFVTGFVPDVRWKKAFKKFTQDYEQSWLTGFAQAIEKRLKSQFYSMTENSSGTGIVHIKRDALELQDFLKGQTKEGTEVQGNSRVGFAYDAGKEFGERVPLGPTKRMRKSVA